MLDPKLDSAEFSLDPPAGYALKTQAKPTITEEEMIAFLGAAARLHDGTFPDCSYAAFDQTKFNTAAQKADNEQTPAEKALIELHDKFLMREANRSPVLQFVEDHTQPDSFHYVGAGAKVGLADQIVLWFTPKGAAKPEPSTPTSPSGMSSPRSCRSTSMTPTPSHAPFPMTDWSRVVRAGDPAAPEARVALAELCAAYWYPIYAFIRRAGHDAHDAVDLTQDYFARLLERGTIAAADASRGRFRAFLRTDCRFFLADRRDRDHAAKRGGDRAPPLSIEADIAEGRYRREPADHLTPDRLFDHAWALTLLESVFDRLRNEYEAAGRSGLFDRLRNVLSGDPGTPSYPSIAADLGMTADAVESAARRLRHRYREALRTTIAATLDDPADLDDEIRDLFAALKR